MILRILKLPNFYFSGIKPQTMWSNDPFGYSNSVPYLFKKSGLNIYKFTDNCFLLQAFIEL